LPLGYKESPSTNSFLAEKWVCRRNTFLADYEDDFPLQKGFEFHPQVIYQKIVHLQIVFCSRNPNFVVEISRSDVFSASTNGPSATLPIQHRYLRLPPCQQQVPLRGLCGECHWIPCGTGCTDMGAGNQHFQCRVRDTMGYSVVAPHLGTIVLVN
jgi:hypothetical protein